MYGQGDKEVSEDKDDLNNHEQAWYNLYWYSTLSLGQENMYPLQAPWNNLWKMTCVLIIKQSLQIPNGLHAP